MPTVPFIKAHGLGNDFAIFINLVEQNYSIFSQHVAKRRYGIGCDQVIFIDKPNTNTPFVRFFNPDGSEAEACGNGSRCVAKYLMQQQNKKTITFDTLGGLLTCYQDPKGVRITMPLPTISPLNIQANMGNISSPAALAVNMGNPHLVCFVENTQLITEFGPGLEEHPAFPERTNVDFAWVRDKNHIELKVWERGTGLTPACGTAACATATAAYYHGLTEKTVTVNQEGGSLEITYDVQKLEMCGQATIVFEGLLNLALFD